jgi:transposase InsO family protein
MHARAKLTPFGRQLVVQRVLVMRWAPAQTAEALGVSRATVYKWLRRFKAEGESGLLDRSSRPNRIRHALSAGQVDRILRARRRWKQGPHRLAPRLGMARSTIYGVLRRNQLSRLRDTDRVTAGPIRYVRERPGELLHLDVKKLGQIPPGGGHRFLGRAQAKGSRLGHTTTRPAAYEYLHVAVDDASRWAFVEIHGDERDRTAAAFVLAAAAHFAELGVRIERVLTDQGSAYRSRTFARALEQIGAQARRTRPYRPQTNGKAERFIKTLVEEWAYARFYASNQQRHKALPRWLAFYNRTRPHTALGGSAPASVVNNVGGNHT